MFAYHLEVLTNNVDFSDFFLWLWKPSVASKSELSSVVYSEKYHYFIQSIGITIFIGLPMYLIELLLSLDFSLSFLYFFPAQMNIYIKK